MRTRLLSARAVLVALTLLALAPAAARAGDDPLALTDADLQGLCEKALAAAVTAVGTKGEPRLALDDADVFCEGEHAPSAAAVADALRAAAPAAKVTLVKHADDLTVPMLRVRASTLVKTNQAESTADHELYVEVEGPDRALLHADLETVAKKGGPGGRPSGAHTAATLDALADRFQKTWEEQKRAGLASVAPSPKQPRPIAQQSLVERIVIRLLRAKTPLVASTRGTGADVARPQGLKLLAPAIGLVVSMKERGTESASLVEVVDLATRRDLFLFRDPQPAADKDSKLPQPVVMVKAFAESVIFKAKGHSYPRKKGKKVKVWLCEAQIAKDYPQAQDLKDVREQMTQALRDVALGRELKDYVFEAHDGAWTNADARSGEAFLTLTPVLFLDGKQKKCGIEVRQTENDTVLETEADVVFERKKP